MENTMNEAVETGLKTTNNRGSFALLFGATVAGTVLLWNCVGRPIARKIAANVAKKKNPGPAEAIEDVEATVE